MTEAKKGRDRLAQSAETELTARSLVGTYFHSGSERGWQGCVVAEPAPGFFLVETFEWVTGSSHDQRLVRTEDMLGWSFYDDAEWMNNAYEHGGVKEAWERQREQRKAAGGDDVSAAAE